MSTTTGKLNQTVTYWELSGRDSVGDPEFAAPVQISARWEEIRETVIISSGKELNAKARVFTDQDIVIGSYVFLGTSASEDPASLHAAVQVQDFQKIPSVKATDFLRIAIG